MKPVITIFVILFLSATAQAQVWDVAISSPNPFGNPLQPIGTKMGSGALETHTLSATAVVFAPANVTYVLVWQLNNQDGNNHVFYSREYNANEYPGPHYIDMEVRPAGAATWMQLVAGPPAIATTPISSVDKYGVAVTLLRKNSNGTYTTKDSESSPFAHPVQMGAP